MTKHPIEVITSVERRRRWSREDKERLVAACFEPGAVVSEIARAAGARLECLPACLAALPHCALEQHELLPISTGHSA